ncbi:hypothetical protein CLAFUW4_01727 [Fulvia fulva]|uniref:Uncharacterized protein n=1 Tax=Passalora fulva TaxID=5499 RepID=A0A9Q8P2P9_PASFU|nr:uncharacterized protein CLAFUR5_01723 [Fulvia fulva]KAK4635017.1 hypothetical protein CLAFUR4_01725 [Fulvia fulva]KAK4636566.1 hypothetical protein CLAFUR0_01726 [Fulvia fulva]UJO10979.1 hypothetical protein CLAFUR5_01723 [Fulvia fulva]WPV08602.1 hypothetical protein CLAFUW4_01727 [Fulvia fulva]WPV24431.1 hypothetical protein CLAFUW7_01729 [Fulvia fulva]
MCGNVTWCPNEATTAIEVQGDPAPMMISASATSACAIPTSADLRQCTKIAAGPVVITEASGVGDIGTAVARRQDAAETGSMASGGAVSCICGSSMTREVWPVTCGSQTWCPNEATSAVEVTGTPAPATLT